MAPLQSYALQFLSLCAVVTATADYHAFDLGPSVHSVDQGDLKSNISIPQFGFSEAFSINPTLVPFTKSNSLALRQSGSCSGTDKYCEGTCIPSGDTCCAGGGGCSSGYYCDSLGCCPTGKTCNGISGACQKGSKSCGSGCIAESATCCPDNISGCPSGTFCSKSSSGSYGCCDNGSTCSGSTGSGSGSGSSSNTCDTGRVPCGDYCILTTSTCCPDLQGGCFSGDYCYLKTDGSYGCCENGSTCTGAASGGSGGSGSGSGSGSGTCDTGRVSCGDYCILTTSTCCPDKQGGCFSGDYCYLKTDGSYGCCENGETCTGAAGGGGTGITSTSTRSTTTRTTTTSSRTSATASTTSAVSGGGVPANAGNVVSVQSVIVSWFVAAASWLLII